jgi:hypothetical protein
MRRQYLKSHKKALFSSLLMSGKLNEHLYEIDQTANEYLERISKQMAEHEGVTEKLKAESQMEWVGKMNSIRNRVEEFIKADLIYD